MNRIFFALISSSSLYFLFHNIVFSLCLWIVVLQKHGQQQKANIVSFINNREFQSTTQSQGLHLSITTICMHDYISFYLLLLYYMQGFNYLKFLCPVCIFCCCLFYKLEIQYWCMVVFLSDLNILVCSMHIIDLKDLKCSFM